MGYLVDVPVEGGGRLLVEAADAEHLGDLELAAVRPGEVAAKARETLEKSLDQLRPAVGAVWERLGVLRPDQLCLEFGLKVAAQAGLVVAQGSHEVHFKVTVTWGGGSGAGAVGPAGSA